MDAADAAVRTVVLAIVCYANIRIVSIFINREGAIIIPLIFGVAMYAAEIGLVAIWQTR